MEHTEILEQGRKCEENVEGKAKFTKFYEHDLAEEARVKMEVSKAQYREPTFREKSLQQYFYNK